MSEDSVRIDKWLWWARFFKTRTLAAKVVSSGLRINGARTVKPKMLVKPGDTLTFGQNHDVRIIEIVDLGDRRGPAAEAQALYKDLDPPQTREKGDEPAHVPRPDKRGRRAIVALKTGDAR